MIPSLSSSTESSPGTAIASFLWNYYGLKLREEWLNSCVSELNNSNPDFANFNVAKKKNLIYERFLFSDMNLSCGGEGVLPEKLQTMKLVNLPGPFLLQEVPSGIKRCLKLSMTDGVQSVYGVEDRPIESLQVLAPAGLKVVIRDVNVRDGLLMLVPGCLKVLGGMVEDLEAERKKLVDEANEPLWVKRTRALAGSAIGAQKPNDADGSGDGAIATLQDAMRSRSSIQGTPYAPATTNTFSRSRGRTQQETENPSEASNIECNTTSRVAADWAEKRNCIPLIQTRIKCVMTAIRRFDYEKVTKYELLVSVDDGSASSDVCIHHDVVLREVYSGAEVLCDFRGTLLVEMNRNSTVPVALEMNNETATFDNSWVMEPKMHIHQPK
ncbi:hypothetical protein C5167_017034 [Papaver somniferum]|uniref:RecQ-mediated genome instability protein 1 n=1 Tax=Papaver somniferum TaxID=3469 RepID=A0A4Y7ILF2_PAPSO|nr:hypothetical protein C5167_017034 [Papaver somniferum]